MLPVVITKCAKPIIQKCKTFFMEFNLIELHYMFNTEISHNRFDEYIKCIQYSSDPVLKQFCVCVLEFFIKRR